MKHVKFSTNSFNSLLFRSPASLLDTNPTLLRCNDYFIHPSRRTQSTQKFVRRHQHDRTSAKVRTPADLVSHHSQDIPEQQVDRKTLVFLNLSGCSSLAASEPLFPTWMPLILFSSCWFSVIASLFPGSIDTSPAPRSTRALFLSFTRSVSSILSLYAFILAFPVKVLSMIVLIRSQHSSFCGFVPLPCDASAAEPGKPPVCP